MKEFEEGDRVIVRVVPNSGLESDMKDLITSGVCSGIGTIVDTRGTRHIGVSFDDPSPMLHDCCGHCKDKSGWYVTIESIEHYDDNLEQSKPIMELYDNLFN